MRSPDDVTTPSLCSAISKQHFLVAALHLFQIANHLFAQPRRFGKGTDSTGHKKFVWYSVIIKKDPPVWGRISESVTE
jgi:hypothetical protein